LIAQKSRTCGSVGVQTKITSLIVLRLQNRSKFFLFQIFEYIYTWSLVAGFFGLRTLSGHVSKFHWIHRVYP
jgi:hypothetical protein